jgi:Peptidase family M48
VASATKAARTRDLAAPVQADRVVTRPATTETPAKEGSGRAVAIAAFPAVVVVVVAVAIGSGLGDPIVGLVVAFVLGAAVWAGVWFGAERLIVSRLGGSFVEDDDVPRAANLVDGLCATMGLPLPSLFLVDDPFRGALSVGRNERSATLVLTTGLLRALDPVELEGVLAHELSHVKSGDMATGTMAAAVVLPLAPILSSSPELVRKLAGSGRELAADVRASSVTRYPPGLRDAIVKMSAGPSPAPPSAIASPGTSRVLRWLWTVVPELLAPASTMGVLDAPATRIAALDEA